MSLPWILYGVYVSSSSEDGHAFFFPEMVQIRLLSRQPIWLVQLDIWFPKQVRLSGTSQQQHTYHYHYRTCITTAQSVFPIACKLKTRNFVTSWTRSPKSSRSRELYHLIHIILAHVQEVTGTPCHIVLGTITEYIAYQLKARSTNGERFPLMHLNCKNTRSLPSFRLSARRSVCSLLTCEPTFQVSTPNPDPFKNLNSLLLFNSRSCSFQNLNSF